MDKFGWFYARNGTTWADDVIKMATGTADYNELGEIKEWKHTNRTHYPDECGQLKGQLLSIYIIYNRCLMQERLLYIGT